jgi:hypothetical protein
MAIIAAMMTRDVHAATLRVNGVYTVDRIIVEKFATARGAARATLNKCWHKPSIKGSANGQ